MIKEGKRPINTNGQFLGTPPWWKPAPLKRPIKRSMKQVEQITKRTKKANRNGRVQIWKTPPFQPPPWPLVKEETSLIAQPVLPACHSVNCLGLLQGALAARCGKLGWNFADFFRNQRADSSDPTKQSKKIWEQFRAFIVRNNLKF